ncbi:FtsH protease activity modulator HflK [Parendozoicomonas sp. Alg238-R29]|uniref:FtsH protease activity modulator HflK n=1 Tax=Parendozoicomonas sp. Alg238-R29 TaxID=2993446 RepID=UPI00248D5F89|nr:FtsH protease activity modulator HflK [Parendozoicomonas sp. Alg238-R29]
MAWNEPGGNNQDPWGGGNKGNNQGPPDLDEAFRKFQQTLKGIFGGKGGSTGGNGNRGGSGSAAGSGGLWVGIVVIAILAYLWNAVYVVDEKERAVILRFGKYTETVGPGLRMYFPPVESRYLRPVTQINTYRLSQSMLTEDENIVEVAMSVQYNITSLEDYVLKDSNPEQSLKEATQSALRHVVGSSEMYKVLTEGREVLGDEVKVRLQEYLNAYGTGLNVIKVNIESSQPPRQVLTAFDDVIRAREEEQQEKNKAEAYANQVIPEARGDAQRIREEAEGYKDEVVSRAKGDASRFNQLLTEYQKAPGVTRERLYLETMQELLGTTSKVLVDVKGGNNMMYLPLDKLMDGKKSRSASGGSSSNSGATALSQDDIGTIADQVTAEINRRVSNSRTGRTAR